MRHAKAEVDRLRAQITAAEKFADDLASDAIPNWEEDNYEAGVRNGALAVADFLRTALLSATPEPPETRRTTK